MAEQTPPIDGIAPPAKETKVAAAPVQSTSSSVKKWKTLLIVAGSIVYLFYALWSFVLISTLPAANSDNKEMVFIGIAIAAVAGLLFVAMAILLFMRISQSTASLQSRKFALIKLVGIITPGLILSIATPLMIMRQPPLRIDIISPEPTQDFIAPLSITFSVEQAVKVLEARAFKPIQYQWDFTGDNKTDQETLDPRLTRTFDREGVYTISVTMVASDRTTQKAVRRLIISRATIAVAPVIPIIDQPVAFSLAHLFPDADTVASVEWDFESDGTVDEVSEDLRASYTYLRTGSWTVGTTVNLENGTKVQYTRTFDVEEPKPLPFPVEIVTEPTLLINTAPFTILFSIESEEPIASVQWNFGDNGRGEGSEVAHTFTQNGSYAVEARVRSASGVIAVLTTVVDVVQRLDLQDLRFEGTPTVSGNRIQGEVPLSLNIKPVTSKPFVKFQWEAPNATQVGSTNETLQAVYRREGNYTVTLIAQDAEGKVLRQNIAVEVKPPSSTVSFQIDPTTGVAPLNVKFDASESSVPGDDITGFIWDFGDDSQEEFGGAFAQHTYQQAGTYTVSLTALTAGDKQLIETRTVVVRAPALQACILPTRLRGPAPLAIEFSTDCSNGAFQDVLWDFNDGAQDTDRKPTHVFMNPGTYNVQLTITSPNGLDKSTTSVLITAE